MTKTKEIPFEVNISIKKNDKVSHDEIENCTAKAFADDDTKPRHYQIGSEITLMADTGKIYKSVIKNIKFWPSTVQNALVLEIFI
jgi:hypothetical protein